MRAARSCLDVRNLAAVAGTLFLFAVAFDATESARAQADSSRGFPLGEPRFDEEAARDWIVAHGFYLVSRLTMDARGTWRGTAVQYGRTMAVEVDAQGQFTAMDSLDSDANR